MNKISTLLYFLCAVAIFCGCNDDKARSSHAGVVHGELTGAQLIVHCLEQHGVTHLFCIPGTPILPLFDALYDSKKIKCILARHEQGAAFMANGYARATGKLGVCLVTAGPGLTNAITAIADAYLDSIPLVVISGQVDRTMPAGMPGESLLQELPLIDLTSSIVKYNYRVDDIDMLESQLEFALQTARSKRPGPVVFVVPHNILRTKTSVKNIKVPVVPLALSSTAHQELDKVLELLKKSTRPMLFVGGGVVAADAVDELVTFARKTGIPVIDTVMARGLFAPDNPQYLGMLGVFGSQAAVRTTQYCDLLIGLGVRFAEYGTDRRYPFATHAKVISINVDPLSTEKRILKYLDIAADLKYALAYLNKFAVYNAQIKEWVKQTREWKALDNVRHCDEQTNKLNPVSSKSKKINPECILQEIVAHVNNRTVFVTGSGQHTVWAMQNCHPMQSRSFMMSGGLGTMGFALPVAIGVQVARPERVVICIDGDGSFQMSLQELATIKLLQTPIKIFILNNRRLGFIHQQQRVEYPGRYLCSDLGASNPDFCALARSYGILGLRITTYKDVKIIINKALTTEAPVLVDCWIDDDYQAQEVKRN